MHIFEENIKRLDLNIPDMPTPLANYVPYKVSDSTVYVSGQGPVIDGKILYSGKVGVDISDEEGIKAAEICCINIIAALKTSINGDWDRFDCKSDKETLRCCHSECSKLENDFLKI